MKERKRTIDQVGECTELSKPNYINQYIIYEWLENSASNQHGIIGIRYVSAPESTKEWTKYMKQRFSRHRESGNKE